MYTISFTQGYMTVGSEPDHTHPEVFKKPYTLNVTAIVGGVTLETAYAFKARGELETAQFHAEVAYWTFADALVNARIEYSNFASVARTETEQINLGRLALRHQNALNLEFRSFIDQLLTHGWVTITYRGDEKNLLTVKKLAQAPAKFVNFEGVLGE